MGICPANNLNITEDGLSMLKEESGKSLSFLINLFNMNILKAESIII